MENESYTDEELFYLASRGDDDAFVLLLSRLKHMYEFIVYLCRFYSEPEDAAFAISHATLEKACKKIRNNPLPRRRWRKMWLRKIARKQFEAWLEDKRGTNEGPIFRSEYEPSTVSDFNSAQFDEIVEAKFECIIGDSRLVLKLVIRHDYSMKDVSERFDCSTEEAEALYFKALLELLAWIETHA